MTHDDGSREPATPIAPAFACSRHGLDREVAATCEVVCERVEERLDELLTSMQHEIGEDRNTARKVRAEERPRTLRYALRRNLHVMLRVIRGGLPLTADEFNWLRVVGTWSADQGIARDRLVNTIQRMALVCSRFFAEEFEKLPACSSVVAAQAHVTELLYGHVSVVSRALLGGFLGRSNDHPVGGCDGDLVIQLLTRTWSSGDAVDEAASDADVSLGAHCGLVLLTPTTPSEDRAFRTQLNRLVQDTGDPWSVEIPGHPVDHAVLLFPTAGEVIWEQVKRTIARQVGKTATVGVTSRPVTHKVARSYRRSLAQIGLAHSLTGGGGVVSLDELEVYHLVTDAAPVEQRSFTVETLGPWFASGEKTSARLLGTLQCYLAGSGKTSEVADELYLDIKTVQNHLRHIRKLTGLDVKVPAQRFRLQLALLFWNLYADDLPAVGDDAWLTSRGDRANA